MNLGNIEIADLWLGATQVKAVYFGDKEVWSSEEPAPAAAPLCFTAISGFGDIMLTTAGSPDAISLEVSRDNITWNDYTVGSAIRINSTSSQNNKLYFRAKGQNQTISKDSSNYYYFEVPTIGENFRFETSGNIQTLLKADGSRTDAPTYCYYSMFYDCFYLTQAPALPATTLASNCYDSMFYGCPSLTTAPSLLATTLASYCYQQMFYGCTSLTTAPALPATTLANHCYDYMFVGCTSLSSIEVAFTTWTSGTTGDWLYDVAASGIFTCPSTLSVIRGSSNIPTNWTVEYNDFAISAINSYGYTNQYTLPNVTLYMDQEDLYEGYKMVIEFNAQPAFFDDIYYVKFSSDNADVAGIMADGTTMLYVSRNTTGGKVRLTTQQNVVYDGTENVDITNANTSLGFYDSSHNLLYSYEIPTLKFIDENA